MAPRLVIIHGEGPGMGQSTLFEGLRERGLARPVDYIEEDSEPSSRYPGYPAHFDRPEFAEVAKRFVHHNADPSAGIGHPTAEMLETVWRRLVATASGQGTTLVCGLSFIDGAEDLDWAMANERALHEHSVAVAAIVAPLDPLFLYLRGDVAAAIDRRVAQRGRAWFPSAPTAEDAWPAFREQLVREWSVRAARIDAALAAGGWRVTPIDGTAYSRAEVLEEAVQALRASGIE